MRSFLYDDQAELLEWAQTKGGMKFREDATAIGTGKNGEITCVAVFDTFSTTSCFVHLVSDGSKRWMTREFITRVFVYPFVQCGYRRITCIAAASNAASLKIIEHFGWVQEGTLREDAEDGSDLLVFGMLRRECRWLPAGIGLGIAV